jgi:predicted dehydrogenase
MQLSREQFEYGRRNFQQALGVNRRDFLRAAVTAPALGAFLYGYTRLNGAPVRAGIVGTGDEGCLAMIEQSPKEYLQYVAYHDIRPSQIARGRLAFRKHYGPSDGDAVRFYDRWEDLLADRDIEAVVIATPLWTHARLAIEAMKAGKHVMCEKLMARNIADAKAMVRTSQTERKILSIGHQRHYSVLYDDARRVIESGALGDVHFIRALWHRNNTHVDAKTGRILDSWNKPIPDEDRTVDYTKFGYDSVEQLVRWRLYDKTGGGLMAELGSHQLDACGIFLGHERPIAVSGVGGKYYFKDDRECEDHVYCAFEYPGGRVVTYSSINTNAMDGYGEIVMGTRGTLMVMNERDTLLFNERDPLAERRKAREIRVAVDAARKGEPTMYSSASIGLPAEAAAASAGQPVSRGYSEELEHFSFCVRNPGAQVRCHGEVGLADAVVALTANIAMRTGQRVEFKPEWFDPASDAVPEKTEMAVSA